MRKKRFYHDGLVIGIPDGFGKCNASFRRTLFDGEGADFAYTEGNGAFLYGKRRTDRVAPEDMGGRLNEYEWRNRYSVPGFVRRDSVILTGHGGETGLLRYSADMRPEDGEGRLEVMLLIGSVDGMETVVAAVMPETENEADVRMFFADIIGNVEFVRR